jgi:hypothetical protein
MMPFLDLRALAARRAVEEVAAVAAAHRAALRESDWWLWFSVGFVLGTGMTLGVAICVVALTFN